MVHPLYGLLPYYIIIEPAYRVAASAMAGCGDKRGTTMSDEQKAREDEVFDQELSMDDLDAAAGGSSES